MTLAWVRRLALVLVCWRTGTSAGRNPFDVFQRGPLNATAQRGPLNATALPPSGGTTSGVHSPTSRASLLHSSPARIHRGHALPQYPVAPLPHPKTPFTPLLGVGVNVVNVFWERLTAALGESTSDEGLAAPPGWDWRHMGGSESKHSLHALRASGIDLIRFAASPYCPHHFALWRLGGAGQALYWEVLDSVVAEAEAAGVRLIPTLMWRATLPSLSCGEDLGRLFDASPGAAPSCARALLHNYTVALVTRYRKRPIIVAWELMNELDLQADLRHVDRSALRRKHAPQPQRKAGAAAPAVEAEAERRRRRRLNHRGLRGLRGLESSRLARQSVPPRGSGMSGRGSGVVNASRARAGRLGMSRGRRLGTALSPPPPPLQPLIGAVPGAALSGCHWDAHRGTTVCRRKDGQVWVGPGGGGGGSGGGSSGGDGGGGKGGGDGVAPLHAPHHSHGVPHGRGPLSGSRGGPRGGGGQNGTALVGAGVGHHSVAHGIGGIGGIGGGGGGGGGTGRIAGMEPGMRRWTWAAPASLAEASAMPGSPMSPHDAR